MMMYAFNGYLFSQRQTGVMRYAREILCGIDRICNQDEFVLVVPEYAKYVPKLKRIKTERHGSSKGAIWEQIDFPRYLKKHNLTSVNFNNTMPLIRPGAIVIHDIAYKIHPEFGSSLHGKISNIYHRIVFWRVKISNKPVITVSHFSKYQLIDEYKIKPSRIHVIGNAWQHVDSCGYDDTIINKYNLSDKRFLFSLGSLSKMKNTAWIMEVAKCNPQYQFIVAGARADNSREKFSIPTNVILVGYITDEQVKSLMSKCAAFIYPSLYDGFGIPPLEALSQGARVLCSNAACLPEIYKDSVVYIDPYETNVDIDALMRECVGEAERVLDNYSWNKSAKEFYKVLKNE